MPFDVEMPDGTIVEDVPDGTTQAELSARYGLLQQDQNSAPRLPGIGGQVGALETLLSLGTGAVAAPVAGLAGLATLPFKGSGSADVVRRVQEAMTYAPRTQAGQSMTAAASYPFEKLAQGADYAGQKATDLTGSPAVGAAVNTGIQFAPALLLRGRGAQPKIEAAAAAESRAQSYVKRAGLDWSRLDAQMRQTLTGIAQDAGTLNKLDPAALRRQVDMGSLPVPVPATRGQLTRDPVQLRNEGNVSATTAGKPIRDVYVEQNKALLANLETLKGKQRGTAQTPEQVGLSVQDAALRTKLKVREAEVKRLYDAADNSGETAVKVDIGPVLDRIAKTPDLTHYGWVESWIKQVASQKPAAKPGAAPAVALPDKPPARNMRTPDVSQDSVLQYIAKTKRGIDIEEARAQGLDPADMKGSAAHAGINRAFRKNGMSFDEAAEMLDEAGYSVRFDDGAYSANKVLMLIDDELRGRKHYAGGNTRLTMERAYDDAVSQRDVTRMADKARKVDSDAVERILESQADDGVIMDQLRALIGDGEAPSIQLSIRQLEDLRKRAGVKTKNGGEEAHYAGEIIRAIDEATEGVGGGLYQKARAARKAQALEFEDQGAVARLVENKSRTDRATALEDTWRRTVLGGSVDDLRRVKRSLLTGGEAATRTAGKKAWRDIQAQTVQHVINEATKSVARFEDGTPNITPAAMERAIKSVGPDKLREIFGPETVRTLDRIMEATRTVKTEPPAGHRGSSTVSNMLALLERGIGRIPAVGNVTVGAIKGVEALRKAGAAQREVRTAQQSPLTDAALQSQNQLMRLQRRNALRRGAPYTTATQQDY